MAMFQTMVWLSDSGEFQEFDWSCRPYVFLYLKICTRKSQRISWTYFLPFLLDHQALHWNGFGISHSHRSTLKHNVEDKTHSQYYEQIIYYHWFNTALACFWLKKNASEKTNINILDIKYIL